MLHHGRLVELVGIEVEDELERNVETAELARHMRDAVREGSDREHEDGVDRELGPERGGRHHALRRVARARERAARDATAAASATASANALHSAVSGPR